MAKKNSILVEDSWLALNELALPPGTTVDDIEKVMLVKPIKVSLEVILPSGASAKSFDYHKNPDIKKFRTSLETKVAKTLAEIAVEDQAKDGKKELEHLNSYLEKAVKAFRVILRTAVAKAIGGNCKPDDLMTAGSIYFEKIDFVFGVGDSSEEKYPLLDLTKAFKRLKKKQHFGVAWKASKIVVSVRLRKPFKEAELKELRGLLPEGSSRGANMSSGRFIAFAKGKVEIGFDEKAGRPQELFLRKAFKKQTGQSVHTTITTIDPDDDTGEPENKYDKDKKDKSKKDKQGKEKAKKK